MKRKYFFRDLADGIGEAELAVFFPDADPDRLKDPCFSAAAEGLKRKPARDGAFGMKSSVFTCILEGKPRHVFMAFGGYREGVAAACRFAQSENIASAAIIAPAGLGTEQAVGQAVEIAELALYSFSRYKTAAESGAEAGPGEIAVLMPGGDRAAAGRAFERAKIRSAAANYAKDLVNEPANVLTPRRFLREAEEAVAESAGILSLSVWDAAECRRRGMSAFTAVASGSENEPYFIKLSYRAPRAEAATAPKVAFIGKTITFDSGGLDLKHAEGMATMKCDMAGGAAVLAAAKAAVLLKPSCDADFYMPAAENMVGGGAARPGDIVRAASGKTIEVGNTDAEGRLTLADAIAIARAETPDLIVDIATLTGAAMVATGENVAALFAGEAAEKYLPSFWFAAAEAGEDYHRLPLYRKYFPLLKSAVADISNISARKYAGATTAALFLAEFAGETPWIHLDIAGPAFSEYQYEPWQQRGGTGFGVRTILSLLENWPKRP